VRSIKMWEKETVALRHDKLIRTRIGKGKKPKTNLLGMPFQEGCFPITKPGNLSEEIFRGGDMPEKRVAKKPLKGQCNEAHQRRKAKG